jgi:hypothetical protein
MLGLARIAAIAISVLVLSLAGARAQSAVGYVAPKVDEPLFEKADIALLEVDRSKLSSNLAAFVANTIKPKSNARQIQKARRMLGLALHLDPRNRTAVVTNFQFTRGLEPKEARADYGPATLAEILQAHARSLLLKGGDLNQLLAGYLLDCAVEIDASNETAVYELEMYKKDVAPVDWTPVVGR